jgi:hypothetical protein
MRSTASPVFVPSWSNRFVYLHWGSGGDSPVGVVADGVDSTTSHRSGYAGTMKARSLVVAGLLPLVVAFFACSGESKLGEECDESGVLGECEKGAICGKNKAGALLCLKLCDGQDDCAASEECNGVEGATAKGCRAK